MTASMKEETNVMRNLAEGIWEEAKKVGEDEAKRKAKKKGAKNATLETRTEVALNLMESLKMSAEEVLNLMRVPVKSRAALLKTISERLAAER